jgi:hypothetical protein
VNAAEKVPPVEKAHRSRFVDVDGILRTNRSTGNQHRKADFP